MSDFWEDDREEQPEIDFGDVHGVRKAEKKAKRLQKELDVALVAMLENYATRQWLWHLLSSCRVFTSSFAIDNGVMAYNEGRRSIGLEVLAEINRVAPERYIEMAREAEERDKLP